MVSGCTQGMYNRVHSCNFVSGRCWHMCTCVSAYSHVSILSWGEKTICVIGGLYEVTQVSSYFCDLNLFPKGYLVQNLLLLGGLPYHPSSDYFTTSKLPEHMYFTSKLAHALLKMCPQCNIYSFSHMRTLAFDYDHLEVRFQALSHPFQTDYPTKH